MSKNETRRVISNDDQARSEQRIIRTIFNEQDRNYDIEYLNHKHHESRKERRRNRISDSRLKDSRARESRIRYDHVNYDEYVSRQNRRLQSVSHSLERQYRRSHSESEEYDLSYHRQNLDRDQERSIKLRSQDVMLFDSKKQSAVFFIRRFHHIVELEGEAAVLRVLLMCLKDFALE
jgi:hypothetical protein